MKSGWKCERCLNAGVIRHAPDADVYTVVEILANVHRTASDDQCTDIGNVRAWLIPALAVDAPQEGTRDD